MTSPAPLSERIVELSDPADPRVADYTSLTDVSLRRKLEPERGLYLAESSKVLRRALAAGHAPRSFFMAEKWLDGLRDVLEAHDVPVYVGEDAVLAPTGAREFVLVITQEQARLIPAEATVEISFEDHTWDAVIAASTLDEYGSTTFTLSAPDGGEVCGDDCGALPNDAQVTLRSEVVIVPEISGTAVPAAAVHTRADGSAYVITESGETEVTVAGSGGGIAVVEGIEVGTAVQALAGSAPAPGTGDEPGEGGTGEDEPPATEG